MIVNIKNVICLVGKRFDLVIKLLATLFIICLFSDYLYEAYNINIIEFNPILPLLNNTGYATESRVLLFIGLYLFYMEFSYILFLEFLLIAYMLEGLTHWLGEKGYIESSSKFSVCIISYSRFISNQSFDLVVLSMLGILCIGGCCYILAMFNHIGYIIAPELYVSAFERINPMSGILSFSGTLFNQVHYEWIQMTVKFCKYVIYGLFVSIGLYISFYIDIKKQRKTFSKRYIKNGSL
ncbi:MAG: hypothetical protein ACLUPK_01030 [Veillonella sp.]